jgi:transposase
MDNLYIGIDIARRIHVAATSTSKPFPFSNTLEGYKALAKWTAEIGPGRIPVYLLEPTGHYFETLAKHLTQAGHAVRLVPGLHTRRAKDLFLHTRHKTDAIDARALALLGEYGQGQPYAERPEVFEELRRLIDTYHFLTRQQRPLLLRLHRCMDLLFPELPGLVPLKSDWVIDLLSAAPTPAEIRLLGYDALRRLAPHVRKASHAALLAGAETTAGNPVPALAEEVRALARMLRMLREQKGDLTDLAERTLALVPYGPLLLTVPSVGTWTAAGILGELGDLRRYRHARQVLKQAGLNLIEDSSGEHVSRPRISRQGRKTLRALLYQASIGAALPHNGLHPWYARLARPGRPKKTVFIAVCRKILKICHAIARDGQPFDPGRLREAATPAL